MVIYIPEEIFQQADKDAVVARELNLLFYLFERGQHRWLLPNEDFDPYSCKALASHHEWILQQMNQAQKPGEEKASSAIATKEPLILVRISTVLGIQDAKERFAENGRVTCVTRLDGQRMSVESSTGHHEWVDINLVNPFLLSPLNIVLENLRSDRRFIEVVFYYYRGEELAQLVVRWPNGGGNDTFKTLEDLGGRERAVCVVDGDTYAAGKTKPDKVHVKERLEAICTTLGYGLHILRKHEMENYLPDEAILRQRAENGNPVDNHPYFALPDEARDYFDLKSGYDPAAAPHPLPGLEVPEAVVAETAAGISGKLEPIRGFGENIWKAWAQVKSREELDKRTPSGELQELSELIAAWL